MHEAVDPVREILLEELEALHNNHEMPRTAQDITAMCLLAQQITQRDMLTVPGYIPAELSASGGSERTAS